jgi:hypothetical protein
VKLLEKTPPTFQEYEVIPKSNFFKINENYYDENDWNELCRYAVFLSDWAKKGDVEEQPGPDGDNLKFGGFVGNYKLTSGKEFKIKLNEDKLNESEYNSILNDIIEWCHILGPNFYTRFNFSNPLHEFENVLSYSNHLIDLSELALSTYLSPIIEQVTKISPAVHGRINVPKTTRNIIQSQTLIVSRKTKLRTDTLPVLLLIRFNFEISRAIQAYLEGLNQKEGVSSYQVYTSFENILMKNLSYHQSFLLNLRNRRLIQRAFELDFYDPAVLSETIRQSNGNSNYHDLVLLWEGYSSNRSLEASLEENFRGGYSLKPISKIYELWVLNKICQVLSDHFGEPIREYKKEGIIFHFKGYMHSIELYYTYNINKFTKFDKIPSELSPDYLIRYSNEKEKNILTLDAKYKPNVSSQDVQQIMAYMLVTGWGAEKDQMYGALLYVGSRTENNSIQTYSRKVPSAQFFKICIRPDFKDGFEDLRTILSNAFSLP